MLKALKGYTAVKRLRKSMAFSRLRQRLPMREVQYVDDGARLDGAETVRIDWPQNVAKPRVGLVRDIGEYPRWTKYRRFLETNGFPYDLYDIRSHDWIERARPFDVVIGIISNELDHLEEIRVKYHSLEAFLGKACYPSAAEAVLYENKCLEAYISDISGIPYARTWISHSKEDALGMLAKARYPLVSKVNQSSGSMGVELVPTPRKARRVVRQAFSRNGRGVHVPWYRQKNYVYFQEFVPNDGYDLRVILVGNWAFGYYRKVLKGDFRASGMGDVEKRDLPEEAIRIARRVQQSVRSPQIVVDMVHGLDGRFAIVEFSIICQVETAEQLKVDGVPGVYVIGDNGELHFEKGRYWVHELALRQFLLDDYLPRVAGAPRKACP